MPPQCPAHGAVRAASGGGHDATAALMLASCPCLLLALLARCSASMLAPCPFWVAAPCPLVSAPCSVLVSALCPSLVAAPCPSLVAVARLAGPHNSGFLDSCLGMRDDAAGCTDHPYTGHSHTGVTVLARSPWRLPHTCATWHRSMDAAPRRRTPCDTSVSDLKNSLLRAQAGPWS
eukprot:363488-Chlamydomonas_euryale.AAC.14